MSDRPAFDRYFDDFQVGDSFTSPGVTLTQSMIVDFALTYDPQPFHIDAVDAAATPFGGLIASGFQTMALGFRMFLALGLFSKCSLGSPGLDELRWPRPVRPGDTLKSIMTVRELRPSRSKPDRGILHSNFRIVNQHGEDVMTFAGMHILARRPES